MRRPQSKGVRFFIRLARVALMFALLYAVIEAIGVNYVVAFFIIIFEPWINLFDKHGVSLGGILTHPITIILGAIIVLGAILNLRKQD